MNHQLSTRLLRQALLLVQQQGLNPVAIALTNQHGELIQFLRMDGAPARTIAIAQAKSYTAARMGVSTQDFHQRLLREQISLADFMDQQLCSLPGGIPVHNEEGQFLGAVGVSGLSLKQDHQLAKKIAQVASSTL